MESEKLIEEVRKFPVLYDQSDEKYRNAEYKDRVWKIISETLKAPGGQEECRKRWASIRDQFRRCIQKRKTKSGQAAAKKQKYKYEDILEFLLPHIVERDTLYFDNLGQKYFHDNYYALFVSKLSGLLVILAVPSILKVLMLTGNSSHPLSAFRRYLDTLTHMLEWYKGDIKDPNSRASKSLLNIRAQHCHAIQQVRNAGSKDISQKDMALTQFGFMGFAVIHSEKLGLVGSLGDVEGFIHFWRVIGYILGINDKYNICQHDVDSTRQICQALLDEVFKKELSHPSRDFLQMSRALLDGVWAIVPFINPDAYLAFTKVLCGIENVDLTNIYSKSLLNVQLFVHTVVLNSFLSIVVRPILNFNMWLSLFIIQRFPYLAYLAFGRNVSAPDHYSVTRPLAVDN